MCCRGARKSIRASVPEKREGLPSLFRIQKFQTDSGPACRQAPRQTAVLQQIYASAGRFFPHFVRPDGYLNLADMGFPQIKHADT